MLTTSPEELLSEIKTLIMIAINTNRSLIIPNILIGNLFVLFYTFFYYIFYFSSNWIG